MKLLAVIAALMLLAGCGEDVRRQRACWAAGGVLVGASFVADNGSMKVTSATVCIRRSALIEFGAVQP